MACRAGPDGSRWCRREGEGLSPGDGSVHCMILSCSPAVGGRTSTYLEHLSTAPSTKSWKVVQTCAFLFPCRSCLASCTSLALSLSAPLLQLCRARSMKAHRCNHTHCKTYTPSHMHRIMSYRMYTHIYNIYRYLHVCSMPTICIYVI